MSRRKEREIKFVLAQYEWYPWIPAIHCPVEKKNMDFCEECHNRLVPAFEALRGTLEPKLPWYKKIFRLGAMSMLVLALCGCEPPSGRLDGHCKNDGTCQGKLRCTKIGYPTLHGTNYMYRCELPPEATETK